jgi:hypothetical protein
VARTSFILALVAAVLVVFFWTGLCFAVAAGAIALGLPVRAAAWRKQMRGRVTEATGMVTTAVIIGGLVLLGGFIALLSG